MNAEKLRDLVGRRPFRPIRIVLHAGNPVDVKHPENIAVGDAWVAVFRDPNPPLVFEADMVVSIEFLRNGARSRK